MRQANNHQHDRETSSINELLDRSRKKHEMIVVPSIEEFAEQYGIAIDNPDIQKKYDLHHRQIMEANSVSKYLNRLEREAIERGFEEGRKRGRAEGIAEAKAEGLEQARLESLNAVVASLSVSTEQAMEVLRIPEIEQEDLLRKLREWRSTCPSS